MAIPYVILGTVLLWHLPCDQRFLSDSGTSMRCPTLPDGKLPALQATDMRASDHYPSTTATLFDAAAQSTEAETASSTAAARDRVGTHAASRPAAASKASVSPPESSTVPTSAGANPPPVQAAAPLLVDPGLQPLEAPAPAPPAAAAPEVPVLNAPAILDDLDLDALLHRLSTTAPATGATMAPPALPVSIVADNRSTNSLAESPAVAAHPADDDRLVSPVYRPRWAKEAHGSTAPAKREHGPEDQSAQHNHAGLLVSQYAGPVGNSSSRRTSNSPNKACLWVKPRPVIKIDLRPDTRDKNQGTGAAGSSMQMPPRFGFGRAGHSAGGGAAGAAQLSGAPAVAAAPLSAANATPAATVEADISDWWEGWAGGKQQQSESSDSEDEWLQFRQQQFKHRIPQQQH